MKKLFTSLTALLLVVTGTAHAQGTAFTYQGRLNDGANAAAGNYDLRFALYDAVTSGAPQGNLLTNTATAITNGLFSVTLDFGNQFSGANRWLEISVRTNGGGAFTTLTTRQPLTPTPYAIFANTASNLLGVVTVAQLPGAVVTNGAGALNLSGAFTGNGANVTNVNAASLNGLSSSGFWKTNGNSGTSPTNGAFLGTTDNQPLEFKVNGGRALRLEPTVDAPNVVGGANINYVAAGVQGATIAGGGSIATYGAAYSNRVESYHGTIGGGLGNWIQTNAGEATIAGGNRNTVKPGALRAFIGSGLFNEAGGASSVIGGGYLNTNAGIVAVIGGGEQNSIDAYSDHAVIGGGSLNKIIGSAGSVYATIGGGYANQSLSNAAYTVIGGGYGNVVQPMNNSATISGGQNNTIQSNASFATISGGVLNYIDTNAFESVISGGNRNTNGVGAFRSSIGGGIYNSIQAGTIESVIGGGYQNTIQAQTSHGTIAGGNQNTIQSGANYSTIGGGLFNTNTGIFATIPGGYLNRAANLAFAAGYNAQATNSGAFVWADNSASTPFGSTAQNQFSARAAGGVRLVTSGAGMSVDGPATVTGLLRSGSETGTAEAPSPAGLVVRRINSTTLASNSVVVVARNSDNTTNVVLVRDGTVSGFQIKYPASPGDITIACMGIDATGAQKNFYTGLLNPATAGTVQIYANSLNLVHFECTFGITAGAGTYHVTQVNLSRFTSGGTAGLSWCGSVISTVNQ